MVGITHVPIDTDTIRRLMAGETKAQEEVYHLFSKAVYSMALRVLRDVHNAEDATQETFLDVFKNAHTLKNLEGFKGWLRRITVNRCLMQMRTSWFTRRDYREVEDVMPTTENVDLTDQINIERAFSSLPPKTRLIIWMYCVEGFTHQEIADTLGRTPSYSKTIVARAQQELLRAQTNKSRSTSNINTKLHALT